MSVTRAEVDYLNMSTKHRSSSAASQSSGRGRRWFKPKLGKTKTNMKVTQGKLQFEVREQCLSSTVFVQVIDCLYLTKPV